MRIAVIVLFLIGSFLACESSKKSIEKSNISENASEVDTIKIENKELEYEIIIIENGFESWLATQRSKDYYTQQTLESKNKFYVMEWNRRVMSPNRYNPDLYTMLIDYDHTVDYGMEVNYLLYMYFEFFQIKYRQRLM